MTLEDFFTLTEMKNGLTTIARVEELISVMQQQKDCVMSNASDAARQWSSVASTLSATENKDCLDHFVKLNGLCYLNQWLQEALKCSNDVAEVAVEELLNSLLGSLEMLPIFRKDSVASGIQSTVEKLVGFKSLDIKEKARVLSERWKHRTENGSYEDMNKEEKNEDDSLKFPCDISAVDAVNLTHPTIDNSTCREVPEESSCRGESAGSDCPSHNSNVVGCMKETSDGLTSTEKQILPVTSLNSVIANNSTEDDMDALPSLFGPNSCQNLSGINDSSHCHTVEMASSATCCSNVPRDDANDQFGFSELKSDNAKDMKMDVDTNIGSQSKPDQMENCKVPLSSGSSVSSDAHKHGRSVSCSLDANENKSYALDAIETLPRSASIDCMVPKYFRNMDLKPEMQDLLNNGFKLRRTDDPYASLDRKEDVGSASDVKSVGNESNPKFDRVDSVARHDCSKPMEKNSTMKMDEQTELGLEYGEIDALEVARQVAIEVEREVVDYREPFCSSSPDTNSGDEMGPQCSDDLKDQPVNGEQNRRGSPSDKVLDEFSPPKDEKFKTAEADIGLDKCEHDVEMSKPVTHESGDNTDQSRCFFDLNEAACVEESDSLMNSITTNSVNVSAPIAVAASKGAPNFPVSPLRFEGEIGWKGSAATSAFRPPSPRRNPDVEKTSSSHKRKANLIEIDLNVADSGDDVIDPLSVNPLPASSGVHSRGDSVEVSSRRADRLKLDLNSLGDEDISPFPPSCWSLPHQNGDQAMSPASSSSSRQPTTRDFDLNDNLPFFDAMGSHNRSRFSSKTSGMHASSKPDNHVITIMGSKIAERQDYRDEAPISFMGNGSSVDARGVALRPMMPYGHIPLPGYGYNYNGQVMGPPMTFPHPYYGPGSMPYMVDSRGATVMPQIMSTSGLCTASSAIPPFLMSMPNTSLGLNGAGASQSGLDVNSGFMSLEAGSRENGSFRNFFMQSHNGLAEEQARAAPQHAAAGVSAKRKEAESGCALYDYKQFRAWQ